MGILFKALRHVLLTKHPQATSPSPLSSTLDANSFTSFSSSPPALTSSSHWRMTSGLITPAFRQLQLWCVWRSQVSIVLRHKSPLFQNIQANNWTKHVQFFPLISALLPWLMGSLPKNVLVSSLLSPCHHLHQLSPRLKVIHQSQRRTSLTSDLRLQWNPIMKSLVHWCTAGVAAHVDMYTVRT